MKKVLLAIAAVLCVGTASAQIQSTGVAPKVEIIYGPKDGALLNRVKGVYCFSLATSNQFDDRMIIVLGDLEDAKQSIKWFIDNFKLGETYNMKDDSGTPFRAVCNKSWGMTYYMFWKDGYAGYGGMRITVFEDMLSALNSL